MEEIITALQNWEEYRTQPDELVHLFSDKQGFILDTSLFPEGEDALHAYAAVKDGELGFYVIAESHDVESPETVLSANCHWCPCIGNIKNDEISDVEAMERIGFWQDTFEEWLHDAAAGSFGMYQTFHIPSASLQPQEYLAFFALKDDTEHPDQHLKAADLVLDNNAGAYFDTIHGEPPYRDRSKYYILDLL